ncbi:TRAP transporter large permease [Paracoccus sp. (in: a-proteobacteria)]|uniref:TRAP transporter large permease n=1 Tax=Paracoccus sp. TaxID=267 RepID=UPI003A883C5C
MTPSLLGFLAFGALGLLLALRNQIAPAVAVVAVGGLAVIEPLIGHGLGQTVTDMSAMLRELLRLETVMIVALFIMLGNLAFYAGISTRIYDASAVWLRHVPGGLAMASVLGCGGFAAISGSSVACATTMGRICVPEMLRQGYDARLATSAVAVGGTLGALIPPSLLFVFYGLLADLPIARLFIAGILPGLVSLAAMLLAILWWVAEEPDIAPVPRQPARASRLQATIALWPPALLFLVLIAGLFRGFLTPVSAAGICVVLVALIGLWQGRLSVQHLWLVLRETAGQTLMALALLVAARLFMGFIQLAGTDQAMVGLAHAMGLSSLTVVALCAIICLILGMFIEPMGILALTLPLLLPLVQAYEMDPIWFGVILVKLLEIALITPPVGLNVFVISGVTRGTGLGVVYHGVARFLMLDLLVLVVLILFPALSTLLPAAMGH